MANLSTYFPAVSLRNVYTPGMTQFNGAEDYFQTTEAWDVSAGVSFCAIIRVDPFLTATRSNAYLFSGMAPNAMGFGCVIEASDNAQPTRRNKITLFSQTSGSTNICHVTSDDDVADGELHTILFSYDPVGGTAHLYVDDVENINESADGYALTTGTPATASGLKTFGKHGSASGRDYPGQLGFVGIGPYIDFSVAANRAKFFYSNLNPIKQDVYTWANSGWGSQPIVWNEHGHPRFNEGSGNNMVPTGYVHMVDEPVILSGFKESEVDMILLGTATVEGAAATTLTLGGLDLSAYKAFKVIGNLKNATGSAGDLRMYFNADTTDTNYYRQSVFANDTALSGTRTNSGYICPIPANGPIYLQIEITHDFDGRARSAVRAGGNVAASLRFDQGAHTWNTVSNVTSITISSTVASSLDVGSTFSVWGIK